VNYQEKLDKALQHSLFWKLDANARQSYVEFANNERLSFQNIQKTVTMLVDVIQWNEFDFDLSSMRLDMFEKKYEQLQSKQKSYEGNFGVKAQKISIQTRQKEKIGFGLCPVASPKTRCCNLLTLDVVESCGFDCSYCSIQSFYNENKVTFNTNLKENLRNLSIDPNEIYHIGTGQSSDSLMWGDKYENLSILNEFAKNNPNVILELKTKSDNIAFFLHNDIAKNIIVTWSLNPNTIIDNEEHLSASLEKRLDAAKKLHDKKILVGFHFHPMVYYKGYYDDYTKICEKLLAEFDPAYVAMVSLGTLTFIKPVIKKIRQRDFHSKILQMPLKDASGKLSYPKEIKMQMFQCVYRALKPWHEKVYFYLCMEDHSYWKEVFAKEYPTNETFELDMKLNYKAKIDALKKG
jgi:spore photoproduct lyase